MKTAKDIAQWVIDNRYSTKDNKVSDVEMYNEIITNIEALLNSKHDDNVSVNCNNCKYQNVSSYGDPCYNCIDYSEHQFKIID